MNTISTEFSLPSLIRFSLPAIFMLILTSIYTSVDGVFVSRFVGNDALSAINIVLPLDNIMCGIAIMFGTGGSAIIGRKLGEEKREEANENFSLVTLSAVVIGSLFTLFVLLYMMPVMRLLGASDRLMSYCIDYGEIIYAFAVPYILQVMFNTLFITAGKPKLALAASVISGLMNIFLDYVFIIPLEMGIGGAAWGTAISRLFGGVFPIVYFLKKRGNLHFEKPKLDWNVIGNSMGNGSSEMVSQIVAGITTLLFNITMMRLMGEEGVAALTIVLYAQFIFNAAYMGFSNSAAPIISFNYGRKDVAYLKKLFRYCMTIIGGSTVLMIVSSLLLVSPLLTLFIPQGGLVYDLAYRGYMIFVWNFLFSGFNIFASALFSALSNGIISALISFLRTFVFIIGAILLLPILLDVDGIWLAIPVAELFACIITTPLLLWYGKKVYNYL